LLSFREDNVSNEDGITDEVRQREEEYFRRQDRELIERLRRAAADAELRKTLEHATGIHDAAQLEELQALGFTPQTLSLLPLVPVLQVAWAEGGISTAERTMIVNLARSREITAGSAADLQLQAWLDTRPSEDTFRKAVRLIGAMLDHPAGAERQVTADSLLKHCEEIAQASGGLFGIGRVSAEEKAALEQISELLKAR
jgi:hypothetical protein